MVPFAVRKFSREPENRPVQSDDREILGKNEESRDWSFPAIFVNSCGGSIPQLNFSSPGWARTTDTRINSPAYFAVLRGKTQGVRKCQPRPGAYSGALFVRTGGDDSALPSIVGR